MSRWSGGPAVFFAVSRRMMFHICRKEEKVMQEKKMYLQYSGNCTACWNGGHFGK